MLRSLAESLRMWKFAFGVLCARCAGEFSFRVSRFAYRLPLLPALPGAAKAPRCGCNARSPLQRGTFEIGHSPWQPSRFPIKLGVDGRPDFYRGFVGHLDGPPLNYSPSSRMQDKSRFNQNCIEVYEASVTSPSQLQTASKRAADGQIFTKPGAKRTKTEQINETEIAAVVRLAKGFREFSTRKRIGDLIFSVVTAGRDDQYHKRTGLHFASSLTGRRRVEFRCRQKYVGRFPQ